MKDDKNKSSHVVLSLIPRPSSFRPDSNLLRRVSRPTRSFPPAAPLHISPALEDMATHLTTSFSSTIR